ncbi:MAG TPA: hypothetical protein VM840_00660 [Actinomycetota bacterium]|nr:hypothetical protein [Actinomycetota bacterium]
MATHPTQRLTCADHVHSPNDRRLEVVVHRPGADAVAHTDEVSPSVLPDLRVDLASLFAR